MPVSPTYAPSIPTATKQTLQTYLDTLYEASDVPPPTSGPDPYVALFTADAVLKMGATYVEGEESITQTRKNMWKAVTKRLHKLSNVAAMSDKELLVNGSVEYTLINEKVALVEFAGHLIFENEKLEKLKYYSVYMDTSIVKDALA